MNWEGVLARFGHNKFLAEIAVREAKVRKAENGRVEWEVVVALQNTLECLPEESDGE